MKKDYLLKKVTAIFSNFGGRGTVLDLGCGDGHYSNNLKNMGFDVTAADMDSRRFKFHDTIRFVKCELSDKLDFPDSKFDYVVLLEVVEHLRKPFAVINEVSRILKPNGRLIISTPNILNIGSRLRFLFEGTLDFFREPTLDFVKLNKDNVHNLHIVVWRYQELEYLLFENGLNVENIYTDYLRRELYFPAFFLLPIAGLQCFLKERRAERKGGVNYRRIDKIIFSKELLFGRHLIIQARKEAGE